MLRGPNGRFLSARATRSAVAAAHRRAKRSHKSLQHELNRHGYSTVAKPKLKPSPKPKPRPKPKPKPKPKFRAPKHYPKKRFRGPIANNKRLKPPKPGRSKIVQRRLRHYPDGFTAPVYEVGYFFKHPLADRTQIAFEISDWLDRQKEQAERYLQSFKLRKSDPDFRLNSSFGAYMVDPQTREMRQPFWDVEKDLIDVEADDWDDDKVISNFYIQSGWLIAGVRLYISPVTGAEWRAKYSNQ